MVAQKNHDEDEENITDVPKFFLCESYNISLV